MKRRVRATGRGRGWGVSVPERQRCSPSTVKSRWTITETNVPMSIFLVLFTFFLTIGIPAYKPHGQWTQYYIRTDSCYFHSLTQPLNVRKTSSNWEKNPEDGIQSFEHLIFNCKCSTKRLDLSMNKNRNLYYGLRGLSLIFFGKFGAWKLPHLY